MKIKQKERLVMNPAIGNSKTNFLLHGFLLASMSENLHTRMVGCEYSFQIWKKLDILFASQTREKVSQLKLQLKSSKKVGSVNDFLLSIKKVVDTLAMVGSPIDT